MTNAAMTRRVRELHRQQEAANATVDIDVKLIGRKSGQVQVSADGSEARSVWIDASDCELEDAGRWTILTMRRGLALQKGLI